MLSALLAARAAFGVRAREWHKAKGGVKPRGLHPEHDPHIARPSGRAGIVTEGRRRDEAGGGTLGDMILTCPNCATKFRVPDSALGPGGRRVRCSACGHLWFAETGATVEVPASDEAAAAPPDEERAAAPPEAGDEIPAADVAEDDFYARRQAQRRSPDSESGVTETSGESGVLPSPLVLAGWGLWLVFVAGLAISLYAFRPALESAWPPISRFYALFEDEGARAATAPAPPPVEEAVTVWLDPQPDWEEAEGGWTATIRGSLTNSAAAPVMLPQLTLKLVDADGKVLKSVAVPLAVDRLAPGETVRFTLEVPEAPAETTGILHIWERGAQANDD